MPIAANGTAYDVAGDKANPAVVLIHGLGINRQMWREFVPALTQRYYVLSYDLYGHGESRSVQEKLSLSLFARQLNDLLDELQVESCAVIGFSLGGMINRRFALEYRDRVSALVILNSPHERDPEEQRIIEKRVADTVQGGPEATLKSSIARWFTPEFCESRPDVIREIGSWIVGNDPFLYSQCREILAKSVTELIRPQPPIAVPSLVLTCENDSGSTPSMSYAIASEIEGAQTVIVPRLQHLGLLEGPAVFLKPIEDFLDSCQN